MGTISVSLPADGTGADVTDYNTPITTIVNTINGNLDSNNLAANAVTAAKIADGSVTNGKFDISWTAVRPTFDVTTIDNGSGGQPTINNARYTQVGKLVTVQMSVTGVKAGTGKNIIITNWGIPTPASITTGQFCGVAGYDDTAIYQTGMAVIYRGTTIWWISRLTDISDNATVSKLSCTFSYETA